MYHTTGLSKNQITGYGRRNRTGGPPILGLYTAVVVTLTDLRRNRVQVELARDLVCRA